MISSALLATLSAAIAFALWLSGTAPRPAHGQDLKCIPDQATIHSVIEDIQRIRVVGEQQESLLRAIRDSLKTSPHPKK